MINKRTTTYSLFLAVLVIGLLAAQLPKLKFDYELEQFFQKNDSDLTYYQDFSKNYGYDNDYLLLGFEAKNGIFDQQFLTDLETKLDSISHLEGTVRILSPLHIKSIIKTPLGHLPIPALHLNNIEKLKLDSAKFYRHPLYKQMFISKSGSQLKTIVIHKRFDSKEAADEYVKEISELLYDSTPRVRMAGKAIAQNAFVEAVRSDFALFILIALGLIFILLIIYMRNLPMIITSLLIPGLSVVSTIGLMALVGKEIDVLSSLIPTILLVVSMSDVIHLYSHIQKEVEVSGNLTEAIRMAVKQVGFATLLTSFTTAVGFLALITINVKPIIDLGIYSAIGIVIAFILTYLLFPSILFLRQPNLGHQKLSMHIEPIMRAIFISVMKKGKLIVFTTLAFLVLGVLGLLQLQIDAYLVNDLPKDNLVKEDFIFFDEEFSGSKPLTLSLWVLDSEDSIYSKKIISEIDVVEQSVRSVVSAGDLLSPVHFVKLANQSLHKGSPDYYKLPENPQEWRQAFTWIKKLRPESKSIKVSTPGTAQITGYFQDFGSRDATSKYQNLLADLDTRVDHKLLGYRMTGTTLLVDKSHAMLSTNLIKGLLFAMIIVAIISATMFRSCRMIIITLIPNIFPILLVSATMGYFQIPLNLSTSIIFAISFGIVVDDTIHFLSKFKHEFQRSDNKIYALKRSIIGTGEPILITTILLTTGFLVFCVSSFSASFYMGLFVSISFATALLADLYLLPLLILWWLPNKKRLK
ncbi:MAG: MMPL family transporter [Reichenbachiella sp.]|uniref:efflux RND transporter permease subunit n=1 Tax=Reichenbachiella sp. TaxID=2184521 RepID=UPI003264C37B